VPRGAAAGRRPLHAVPRARLGAARLPACGAGPRPPDGDLREELGQPLEQVGDPADPGPAVRLERDPARGGADAARRAARACRGDGRAQAPTDESSKADYYDSIHHSAAVVGLNTTAMIEAAIVGRPVLTVLDPEYEAVQHGTLHFRYLLETGGGVLRVAETLSEHVA